MGVIRGGGSSEPTLPSSRRNGGPRREGRRGEMGRGGFAGDLDLAPRRGQLLADPAPLSLTVTGLPQAWGHLGSVRSKQTEAGGLLGRGRKISEAEPWASPAWTPHSSPPTIPCGGGLGVVLGAARAGTSGRQQASCAGDCPGRYARAAG